MLAAPGASNSYQFGAPGQISPSLPMGDSAEDAAPEAATDGAGNWVAVWQADAFAGSDDDILVARSSDDGETWTAAEALNTNAASDTGLDWFPHVATDGAGTWIAVWQSTDTLGGTIGSDYDILYARSTDNGDTWTAPAPLNSGAASDTFYDELARIVTDGSGNWMVVWDQVGMFLTKDILMARSTNNGASWSSQTTINSNAVNNGYDDEQPSLATDGAGNWVVVWNSTDALGGLGNDYEILVTRSTNNGASWSAAKLLNSNWAGIQTDRRPSIATDGNGNWVTVWSSSVSGFELWTAVSRSQDVGETWTDRVLVNATVSPSETFEYKPRVVTDGAGNWMIAFSSAYPDELDATVRFVRSTDNGQSWTIPGGIHPAFLGVHSGIGDTPVVASMADGKWLALWVTRDDLDGYGSNTRDIAVSLALPCDDGNPCTSDGHRFGVGCESVAGPASQFCMDAGQTKLQVDYSGDPTRSKLSWQWSKGDGFFQSMLGDPLVDEEYSLCLYDTVASTPSLVAAMDIPPSATFWESDAPKGVSYRDQDGTSGGVTKLQIKTSTGPKAKVKLSAEGSSLPLPAPAGATYFNLDSSVVAQLVNRQGACWASTYVAGDVSTHDTDTFKGRTKQ